ncbi:hypothetical protein Tco_1532123 [Tanacetum coccineum]
MNSYVITVTSVNILLLGLPVDIYTLINHYQTAKKIWDRVKELMEGTKMTKQERESMLYNEFDKFTSEPGESIHSYYLIFSKFINDMNVIPMSMTPMQINTKFVNHLQPKWSRFVTTAKQARNLHSRQSQGYAGNVGNNQASRAWVINAAGNTGANQPRFKDKMLLAQAQEAGVVLDEEQQDFLADSLEETGDYEDLQLQATTNFKADHVDAYDSDCDDEAITHAIFMANMCHIGSLNDDTVSPRYDSNTLSKSYDELKGNNNVISYTDYMLTIGNDEDNYVPPPVQKNDMMLYYVVPYGELDGISVALVARFGVVSKSADRILISHGG